MREEIIEAIGDAIAKAWNSEAPAASGLPPIDLIGSERDYLASAAFDAALARMRDPSPEMLAAFWEAGDDCWGGTHAVVKQAVTAMLTTLERPHNDRPSTLSFPSPCL